MAWISQMKVVESRTVFSEGRGNGKAEREFTIAFAPGELKADDLPSIQMWCKQMSEACKCSIDEALPQDSKPRTPEQGGKPAEPDKSQGPATENQLKYIKALVAKKHDPPEVMRQLREEYEIKELKELTFGQASGVIERLKEKK
jgi:hypothetical protein